MTGENDDLSETPSSASAQPENEARLPRRILDLNVGHDRYKELLAALDELLEVLAPYVAELDTPEQALRYFKDALESIPPSRSKAVVRAFSQAREEDVPFNKAVSKIVRDLAAKYPNEHWVLTLGSSYYRAIGRQRRSEILYRSLITSAVSGFEVLLAAVVTYFFSARPDALGGHTDLVGGEKEFSLADLEDLGSIDDARQLALARRVEGFLFESFGTWSRWFERNLGFSFEDIALDWPRLVELIERRHVIVHNGALVSRRYLSNLVAGGPDPLVLGSQLSHDEKYIRAALAELRVLGTLLLVLTWVKLDVEYADDAVAVLHAAVYEALLAGQWQAASALAQAGAKLKLTSEHKLLFQMNDWLARQRRGIDVAGEVRALDVSALSAKFRMAKAVLLSDFEAALTSLRESIRAQEVSFEALYEWPILDPLREQRAFPDFMAEAFDELRARDPYGYQRFAEGVVARTGHRFHTTVCRHAPTDGIPMPRRTGEKMGLEMCRVCT